MNKKQYIVTLCFLLLIIIEGVFAGLAIVKKIISRDEFVPMLLIISTIQAIVLVGFLIAFKDNKLKKPTD